MGRRENYDSLVAQALEKISEIFPWDLEDGLGTQSPPLLVDVRERDEFEQGYIPGSINVPRGILEAACDFGFAETVPELVRARELPLVVICRSGRRSALAARTMRELGYSQAVSLKLGVKGWNDSEFPLIDGHGNPVDGEEAEKILEPEIRPEQLG